MLLHGRDEMRETVTMTQRIGYKASAEQFNPRELVEFAVQAEQVGLDSVMISDHFQPWRHTRSEEHTSELQSQ